MIEELTKYWNEQFGKFRPEAHQLKHQFRDRWVRFHTLPDSKRYPESELEYQEIFRRHNLLLRSVTDLNPILVVVPEYSENREASQPEINLQALFSMTSPWVTLKQHEDDDPMENYWHLHVAKVAYSGAELNGLFRLVANDEVGNILILCITKNVLYHPYDGGADVILPSSEKRDIVKEKYKEWLSSHPEGY